VIWVSLIFLGWCVLGVHQRVHQLDLQLRRLKLRLDTERTGQ